MRVSVYHAHWVPAGQYRRPRRLKDLQAALDFGEPPEYPLGHLERIASLLPQGVQFVYNLIEPRVNMPSQLAELVSDRGSPRRRHTPPPAGRAVADRLDAAVACRGAGAEVKPREEIQGVRRH
jgi:hypothetical protein